MTVKCIMVSVFAPFPHLILGEANRIDRVNTHRYP